MDRLTTMEAFVRVAEAGSFAEAARRWGRSKAVVSKYVAQLEEHLGVRLLRRTTRTVRLTDAGAVHLERCQQVLSMLEESESAVRAEHATLRGRLRVTAPPSFLSLYRHEVVVSFLERYPEVSLELDLTHRMVDLVDERIDVAIRLTRPRDSSLIARRLGPAALVLVAAPVVLERLGTPHSPRDLADLPCLLDTNFAFGSRWPFMIDGRSVEVDVSGPVSVNSPMMVRELALDGVGIALVPWMLVADDLARGALRELMPGAVDTHWSVWAITSQRRYLSARARAFIDHVRDRVTGDDLRVSTRVAS